jgi:hypothetical protein
MLPQLPAPSFHQGKIPPEVSQTVRATEECGEIRRVHEHDVSGTLLISPLCEAEREFCSRFMLLKRP